MNAKSLTANLMISPLHTTEWMVKEMVMILVFAYNILVLQVTLMEMQPVLLQHYHNITKKILWYEIMLVLFLTMTG